MKTAILLIAAGVLSMSAAVQAQTIIQQNQGRVAPLQSGTNMPPGNLAPGNIPSGQPQIGGVALPQLPADLQNPLAASQASADIFAFMALFQKMAQEMRGQAREQRSAEREAQFAALTDVAEKMKQAAAANMQQAQVTGAMAIASGAMSAGMAGAGAQLKPATQGKTMTGPQQGKTPPLQAPTKALTLQEKQQAAGAMASAQQGFTANMMAAEVDKKKAEAAAQAAQAQAQTTQQVQAQQMMQQMMDVIRDVQQKLQAIQQSQTATAQTIMRN